MIAGRVSKRRRQADRIEVERRARLDAEFDALIAGPSTTSGGIRHRGRKPTLRERLRRLRASWVKRRLNARYGRG